MALANSARRVNALRAYYFLVYIGLGAVLPLLALSLAQRGLSPAQYAYLIATIPLSRLLAPPLWGAIADKWLGGGRLLRVNTLLSALAMAALSQPLPLPATACAFVAWALFSSSLMPLAEAGTLRLLGERRSDFALIRVFGSIGFAVSALAMGLLGPFESTSVPFWAGAFGYLAAVTTTSAVSGGAAIAREPLLPALRALVKRRDVRLLWAGSIVYYVGHGAFDAYYGPHVRQIPGVTDATVSLCWALGVTSEIVIMFFVPRLFRAHGHTALLVTTSIVASARWLLLALASSPLEVWLLQPAHAVTFGVWYLAFIDANQHGAPEQFRATVQGFAAACLGSGMIVATLLGGYVVEAFGSRVLFLLAAAAALLSSVLYFARGRVLEPLRPLAAQGREA